MHDGFTLFFVGFDVHATNGERLALHCLSRCLCRFSDVFDRALGWDGKQCFSYACRHVPIVCLQQGMHVFRDGRGLLFYFLYSTFLSLSLFWEVEVGV